MRVRTLIENKTEAWTLGEVTVAHWKRGRREAEFQ
jgi:hypothetical protein